MFPEAKQAKLDYAKELVYPVTQEGPLLDEMRVKMGEMPWAEKKILDIDLSFFKRMFTEVRFSS